MPELDIMLLLFVVAIVAACLDTLAGGGGLLVLPALILAGLPPLYALGTNKMQGTMGTATATWMMLRHRRVAWSDMKPLMLWAFAGSALGSIAVQFIDASVLRALIPVVLVGIASYFLLSGKLLDKVHPVKLPSARFRRWVLPGIGGYDGMIGPGAGSFFAVALVAWQGKPLLEATAMAKCLNFATNAASLLVFLSTGKLLWQVGLVMMAGQMLGAWAGSHLLFRSNPQLLRVLIVVLCLAMLLRYFIAG
ncbi:MAG: TSUP family transporter [Pseudomonadales bacterium]|nr:TSUP family transporter [Pseudomonadales bacterium]